MPCVHSGTVPFSDGAYSANMSLVSIKAVLAAFWVAGVCLAGALGNQDSRSSWTVLVGVALLPPIVLMWRWHDPRQTLSESIQAARK